MGNATVEQQSIMFSRCEEPALPDRVPHLSAAQNPVPDLLPQPASRSRLLSALTPVELAWLRSQLKCEQPVHGQALHESGERSEHAYCVEVGLVSMREPS